MGERVLPPKVFIIDDFEETYFLVRALAAKVGLDEHLGFCNNPTHAVRQLSVWRDAGAVPKLVLLDIKMPALSGFDVLRWLRNEEGLRDIFVVMLSSSEEAQNLTIAHELGADSYLVKYPASGVFAALLGVALSAQSREQFAADVHRLGFVARTDAEWKLPHHLGSCSPSPQP